MEPVERISLLDQVVVKLKEHIAGADVEPGDRMPTENAICDSLLV